MAHWSHMIQNINIKIKVTQELTSLAPVTPHNFKVIFQTCQKTMKLYYEDRNYVNFLWIVKFVASVSMKVGMIYADFIVTSPHHREVHRKCATAVASRHCHFVRIATRKWMRLRLNSISSTSS